MNLLGTTLLLFRTHFARSFTTRRSLVCIAVACIPPAVAATLAHFARRTSGVEIATHLGWHLSLQVILPVLSLVAGSAVVAEEVEDRTITYLFTRPIPRAAVLLGRWLATMAFLLCVLTASTVLMLWAADRSAVASSEVGWPLLRAMAIGAAVYSALFAVAGVFLKHPMIAGLAYAFAIEGLFANLPGETQSLSIQHFLRSIVAARAAATWEEVEGFTTFGYVPESTAFATLTVVLCTTLLLGAWRIRRREFVLTA